MIFRQIIILIVLPLFPALITGLAHPKRPSWNENQLLADEIALSSAIKLTDRLWVDARSASDYEKDHIPGALLLNEDAWDELLAAVLLEWSPEKTIVVYCSSSQCQTSREVAKRLRETVGIELVFVLKGGWEAWQDSKNSSSEFR